MRVMSNQMEGLYWIGINDQESEAEWVWSDGSSRVWTNWGMNEPKQGAELNCGVVRIGLTDKWFDSECSNKRFFICKDKGKMYLLNTQTERQ